MQTRRGRRGGRYRECYIRSIDDTRRRLLIREYDARSAAAAGAASTVYMHAIGWTSYRSVDPAGVVDNRRVRISVAGALYASHDQVLHQSRHIAFLNGRYAACA